MSHPAQLFLGKIMHKRHLPVEHAFTYSFFMLCLPLTAFNEIKIPFLGINCANLFSFHEKDHGPLDGSALLPWIKNILKEQGVTCADGEVILQTQPRFLGYVFNPVSFWFCYDKSHQLRAVLCEVSNTFGERHLYLVAHPDRSPIRGHDKLHQQKIFHVSPFFAVRGEYYFHFERHDDHVKIGIDYHDNDTKVLTTRLVGQTKKLTLSNFLNAFIRCPFVSLGVMIRIYWQALHLFFKKIPFHKKPDPPRETLS